MSARIGSLMRKVTFTLLFALVTAPASSVAEDGATGVVVRDLGHDTALARAGAAEGDLLLFWVRPPAPPARARPDRGQIESVFDWWWLEVEQGARGRLVVSGLRDARPIELVVEPGLWDDKVRPPLPEELLEAYLESESRLEAGDNVSAADVLQRAIVSPAARSDWRRWVWLETRLARAWNREGELQRALDACLRALRGPPDPAAQAWIWDVAGTTMRRLGRLDDARVAYQKAMDVRSAAWGESLSVAQSWNQLGIFAWSRGEVDTAEELFARALTLRERLAPGSLYVAQSLNNLGATARKRGDLALAEERQRRALVLRERLAPESDDIVASLSNLGLLAFNRGRLKTAEKLLQRSLALDEKLSPAGHPSATTLSNLGLVAQERGDLAMAEAYERRALAILEGESPASRELALSLDHLGDYAATRGDFAEAERHLGRALAMLQGLSPESLDLALVVDHLGSLARVRGDLASAEEHYLQALAIRRRKAPESLNFAWNLKGLGELALERGEPETARRHFEEALKRVEELAPESLGVATCLGQLANVARAAGRYEEAEAHLRRALSIQQELAPYSEAEATTLRSLAALCHQTDRPRPALELYERATRAVEAQIGRLGGSRRVRERYRAQHRELYRDMLDLLLELDRAEDAFHVLERSRARGFLAMLTERDLVFAADLPPETQRRRREVSFEYDQVQQELAGLSPDRDRDRVGELLARLGRLRGEREEIVSWIRQTSPRLASLRYPEPLDLEGVRRVLDPATVMLSYSVGEDETILFAVDRRQGLRVESLGVGAATLRQRVEAMRGLIRDTRPGSGLDELERANFEKLAGHLYVTLVEPVEELLEDAERVLVVPDGALHRLPFGALVRETGYFVEWKPIHVVLSATVYARLRARRRGGEEPRPRLTAFGDPKYPVRQRAMALADARLRSATDRGLFDFEALPHSRAEVERIAAVFPSEAVRVHLGEQATEERAKAVDRATSILHFATHGAADEVFPLNSFLALSLPEELEEGRDNGLLQAWEIFESLRLDADLVVLSACETGLGRHLDGEGLIGLTRAFQYAGARTVAATLWSVADPMTSRLMVRFYRHLHGGKTKDQALRAAQMEMIASADACAPYYWAAFQLYGDWR